jgi:hypothetical protein
MSAFLSSHVRFVDRANQTIGRFAMYLLFAMMGIMLWSSLTKFMHLPAMWTLEMALVAYYMLVALWRSLALFL